MLTEQDLEFMADSQDEIYVLRYRPITVSYTEKQYDEITEEVIGEREVSTEIKAVVTEISEETRTITSGIAYESGDAKFDVKLADLGEVGAKIERISYDDNTYEILGSNKKGIGRRNRIEFIGRVIT
ncbi:hypothetical protein [Oceanobacillus neutriphilus]|uniref:Phage protein n=1 Tax=Oceanobacillus neutriphilus TaxID=531815 RepID=A0ABQ2NY97_9BACI|nr:hypothetical protein [Oceanobacillus neutriphilus]GGP13562.1 hypothetical protein GCM10011346_34050 [Oceanobacillus neutriphilus]